MSLLLLVIANSVLQELLYETGVFARELLLEKSCTGEEMS